MSGIRGNVQAEYDLAVRQGNTRRLRTLIKHRAEPPVAIMLFALIRKHPELLGVLKEAGANPNDADGFNERALGHAINYYGLDVVETLLRLGADPNLESLHLLPLVHAAYDDKIEYVRLLLANGADPNRVQWNGVTPLWAAVQGGHVQVVKLLLQAGADPAFKGPDGKNAIELARSVGRQDLVPLLESFLKRKRK